ncbi:hypothetical protein L6164_002607 [Bauhinia variegata]|uniref:Uncharacterized protein n=1 Tax=Bauhinia variegata TaxID=167791 RepID=A0ACB9PYR6_BAUVA|nr:hypothetical protein L6164_002607 [Bauhinia variegata]
MGTAAAAAAASVSASTNYTSGLSKTDHEMIKSHIIDIPKETPALLGSKCCIYSVPDYLRKTNPKAYSPQLISIGPIHYRQKKRMLMEKQKHIYFYFFWDRLAKTHTSEKCQELLGGYKSFLEKNEEHIRYHYSQQFPNIKKDAFVGMMLFDSVFIMELFLRKSSEEDYKDDYMFSKLWVKEGIWLDLLLLENQIPMFVLKKLYETVVLKGNEKTVHATFVDLARQYFKSFYDSSDRTKSSNWKLAMHFTDLVRYSYIPFPKTTSYSGPLKYDDVKSAIQLKKSGICFEASRSGILSDVKFEGRKFFFPLLEYLPMKRFEPRFVIPQLKVELSTESVLRNIIAFEQCHYRNQPQVSNYVSLLDALIETPEDLDFLVANKVLVHQLGSDKEIGLLISDLSKDIATNGNFNTMIDDLNKHHDKKWHRAMTKLRLVYFQDVWRGSSTLVGLLVLFFTFYNFYRSIHPNKPSVKLFTI